jgi:Curlin associated repeat
MIRKLMLATTAVIALSAGAQAANTVTTTQTGFSNTSTTTQNGFTNDSATLTQAGVFNTGTANQGLSSISATRRDCEAQCEL